ncbi:hypothetical protein [Sphingobium sp.]|uniref:hypothetical protein n=1 Tax=Sphingobium sp. TaxID=1912891 RepID=UPI003BB59DEE
MPQPAGQRFRGFRTEFGKVASGSGGSMAKALQKYASAATGGSAVGPRRFGPAYAAGADLAQALSGGEIQTASGTFNLSALAGMPVDEAAQAIAEALAPENADVDQVRAAMQEALAEVLGEDGVFDPAAIEPDQIVTVLVEFFSQILFQEISAAAGEAWKKAPSVERSTATENELLEVVRAAMDAHLSPRLTGDLGTLTRDQIAKIEQSALADIWQVWSDTE